MKQRLHRAVSNIMLSISTGLKRQSPLKHNCQSLLRIYVHTYILPRVPIHLTPLREDTRRVIDDKRAQLLQIVNIGWSLALNHF